MRMTGNNIDIQKPTGLVLEGGGMRCIFAVGVLDYLMDNGIWFPLHDWSFRRSQQRHILRIPPAGAFLLQQHRTVGNT